ncbi:hypothetical protein LTR97_002883 [Elasticomyces elasticus]|uniref:Uncharacterized protein n=1 Tax=Elasticomyces elasticus TaxID=574655 RepID=A0AAN7WNR3_9PEZI|nr:hypothetical protein LTR97_002883 [Elasticomyces elasticus]
MVDAIITLLSATERKTYIGETFELSPDDHKQLMRDLAAKDMKFDFLNREIRYESIRATGIFTVLPSAIDHKRPPSKSD